MACICDICNKGLLAGNNVSHSNRHTKRSWKRNIQKVKANVDGQIRTLNVCTRCMRSGKIARAN